MKSKWWKIGGSILLICCSFTLSAQDIKFSISGTVLDTNRQPLPYTTAVLLQASDSVLYKYTVTDNQGAFYFKSVKNGKYILQLSYMGFRNKFQPVDATSEDPDINLGNIILKENDLGVGETKVEQQRIPILFKEDTVEYNAGSYKTKPNDVVEDLLKKLPGVEVDKDGTVKAQGEEVKKVFVDGKEFFGDDPKLATKNLPADAVDKVQVYEKLSDMAEFTGIDDGTGEKAINLILKENKKKGVFGSATAGYGTEERYEGKFNVNRFTKKMQLSALGMLNNTNQQGFSTMDYINFMGGVGSFMSGRGEARISSGDLGIPRGNAIDNGLVTTGAGGFNFNYDFNKKTELRSNYFYNRIENELVREASRQNFTEFRDYTTLEDEEQNSRNANHRFNVRLEHELDSTQDLIFKSNLRWNNGSAVSMSDVRNISEGALENSALKNVSSQADNMDINTGLTYRKKMKKKGRSFVTDLELGWSDDTRTSDINNIRNFILRDSLNTMQSDTTLQDQDRLNTRVNYKADVSYTEPLGKGKYLEFEYSYSNYTNKTNNQFYDKEALSEEVILNKQLSTEYNNDYNYHNGGINYKIRQDKSNLTAGVALQKSELNGNVISTGQSISKDFLNVLPSVRWRYRFGRSKRLNIDYRTSVDEPSIDELQPVVNNQDPLKIYLGNPDLKAAYSHSLRLRYMLFSQFSFTSFFASLTSNFTTNKITNKVSIDPFLTQTTQPVNVDYDYRLTGYFSFSTPVKFLKTKIRISSNATYNRGILFVNTVQDNTDRFNNSIDLSLENLKKDHIDVRVGTKLSNNSTSYSISKDFNNHFFSESFYVNTDITFLKNWTLTSSFDYIFYNGKAFSNSLSVPLWTAGLSRYFLKNNKGELKLFVFDILNENKGITRTSQFNYIEEERMNTLNRYFMLSFTYKLTKMADGGREDRNWGRWHR